MRGSASRVGDEKGPGAVRRGPSALECPVLAVGYMPPTAYFVNAPPAHRSEFGPSAA